MASINLELGKIYLTATIERGGGRSMFNSKAFRRFTNEADISQAMLVQDTGLSRAYISALMNGKVAYPSLHKSMLVAHSLGMTVDEFYDMFMEEDE